MEVAVPLLPLLALRGAVGVREGVVQVVGEGEVDLQAEEVGVRVGGVGVGVPPPRVRLVVGGALLEREGEVEVEGEGVGDLVKGGEVEEEGVGDGGGVEVEDGVSVGCN